MRQQMLVSSEIFQISLYLFMARISGSGFGKGMPLKKTRRLVLRRNKMSGLIHGRPGGTDVPYATDVAVFFENGEIKASNFERPGRGKAGWSGANDSHFGHRGSSRE